MKTALCSLGLVTLGFVAPFGCDHRTENPVVLDSICSQVNFDLYEFEALGTNPAEPTEGDVPLRNTGTFELNSEGQFFIGAGMLIVDDDDLLDDYPRWLEARETARIMMEGDPEKVEARVAPILEAAEIMRPANLFTGEKARKAVADYAAIDPETPAEEYSDEQNDAVNFVDAMKSVLTPACSRLAEGPGTGVTPRPGDDLTRNPWPSFTACKDIYNASGDGVIATFPLNGEGADPRDVELSQCLGVEQTANEHALNVWGPLTTRPNAKELGPGSVRPIDGFNFSGLAIPVESAEYQRTIDRSEWEGVSFWARLADKEEALPVQSTPTGQPPYDGRPLPDPVIPQDGVGQLGISVQTIDTGGIHTGRTERQGLEIDAMKPVGVCVDDATAFCFATQEEFDAFPGPVVPEDENLPDRPPQKYAFEDANGDPQTPLVICQDYSPADTLAGEETSYREQCWDGFRYVVDISPEWKFYFLPFSEMRQFGWGTVSQEFRTDQIRSVGLLTSAFQPVNIKVDEISYYRRK